MIGQARMLERRPRLPPAVRATISDPSMTDPKQGDDRRGAIAGLIIAVVLLGVGIWLARDLTSASKMQDCLMSGRTNCNVIEPAR
jgi:hypothetical protein